MGGHGGTIHRVQGLVSGGSWGSAPSQEAPCSVCWSRLNRNVCPLGLGLLYKLLKIIIKARHALNFKTKCFIKVLFPNLHY